MISPSGWRWTGLWATLALDKRWAVPLDRPGERDALRGDAAGGGPQQAAVAPRLRHPGYGLRF